MHISTMAIPHRNNEDYEKPLEFSLKTFGDFLDSGGGLVAAEVLAPLTGISRVYCLPSQVDSRVDMMSTSDALLL